MADSKAHHVGTGGPDCGDDGTFTGIGPQMLGLNLPFDPFVSLVNALIDMPIPFLPIAVGENGPTQAQSNMFWTYNPLTGLHVETAAGYLSGAPGTGGFNMNVLPDGAWALQFDGTHTVIGADASGTPPPPPPPPAGNTVLYITKNGADGGDQRHRRAYHGGWQRLARRSGGGLRHDRRRCGRLHDRRRRHRRRRSRRRRQLRDLHQVARLGPGRYAERLRLWRQRRR